MATSDIGATAKNGANVTLTEWSTESWRRDTLGWDAAFGSSEDAPWKWDAGLGRPVLWFE